MKIKIPYLFVFVLSLSACDLLIKQEPNNIIAVVNEHRLYEEDIIDIIPNNISTEDSIIFVKSFIDDWALDKILMDNALYNLPLKEQDRYQKMVDKYKSELFKKAYLDALLQKEISNDIDSTSIAEYYEAHKSTFRVNEHLLKIRYLYASNELKEFKKIKKSFQRFQLEDIYYLEDNELKFDKIELNDSVWVKSIDVFKKLNKLNEYQQKALITKKRYYQFSDSIGTHFILVKDILKPNDIAPLSYIKPTVEQIIINKKKLKIQADLKNKILKDAINDRSYEVFK